MCGFEITRWILIPYRWTKSYVLYSVPWHYKSGRSYAMHELHKHDALLYSIRRRRNVTMAGIWRISAAVPTSGARIAPPLDLLNSPIKEGKEKKETKEAERHQYTVSLLGFGLLGELPDRLSFQNVTETLRRGGFTRRNFLSSRVCLSFLSAYARWPHDLPSLRTVSSRLENRLRYTALFLFVIICNQCKHRLLTPPRELRSRLQLSYRPWISIGAHRLLVVIEIGRSSSAVGPIV